jgi:hypothetical protein
MRTTLNYTENGGDATVIGGSLTINGTLEIAEGATVTGVVTATVQDDLLATEAGNALDAKQGKILDDKITAVDGKVDDLVIPTVPVATFQADSTATELAGLVTDFNALLAKLKTAGIMASE